MNQTEFAALRAKCGTIRQTYFAEAVKTAIMLGNCTPKPLRFDERFALLAQEVIENDAHLIYLSAKCVLRGAVLHGYEALPKDGSAAAMLAVMNG